MDSNFPPPFMPASDGNSAGSSSKSDNGTFPPSPFPAPFDVVEPKDNKKEENKSDAKPESDLTKETFKSVPPSPTIPSSSAASSHSELISKITRKIEELETIEKQKEEAQQIFENNLRISKDLKENFISNIQGSNLKSELKEKLIADIDQVFAKNIQALNENPENIQKKIAETESQLDKDLNILANDMKEAEPKEVLPLLFELFISIQESAGNIAQKVLKVILPVFEKYLNSEEVPDVALLKKVNNFLERVGEVDPKGLKTQGPVIVQNLYEKLIDDKLGMVEKGSLTLDEQKKANLSVAKRLLESITDKDGIDMYRSILTTVETALR